MNDADGDARYPEAGDDGAGDARDVDDDNLVATRDMCHHCFDALLKELIPKSALRGHDGSRGRKQTKQTNDDDDAGRAGDGSENRLSAPYVPPAVDCPLFVTWSKRRAAPASSPGVVAAGAGADAADDDDDDDESEYDLRGCIGTLAPRPLDRALSEFAVTSALHDQRFDPIAPHELPLLRVGVSLLVDYEECDHCLDWVVGVHGIIIRFEGIARGDGGTRDGDAPVPGRAYSATYLPEVAREQGWGAREAVASLVRKAGYPGAATDGLLARVRCTRYRSSRCRLAYGEHVAAGRRGVGDSGVAAPADGATRRRTRPSRPCVNL